jgi:hypothetical protein
MRFSFRKFAFLWQQYQNQLNWDQFENHVVKGIMVTTYFLRIRFQRRHFHQFQHQLKSVVPIHGYIIDRHFRALQNLCRGRAKVGVLLERLDGRL